MIDDLFGLVVQGSGLSYAGVKEGRWLREGRVNATMSVTASSYDVSLIKTSHVQLQVRHSCHTLLLTIVFALEHPDESPMLQCVLYSA